TQTLLLAPVARACGYLSTSPTNCTRSTDPRCNCISEQPDQSVFLINQVQYDKQDSSNSHSENGVLTILDEGAGGSPRGCRWPAKQGPPSGAPCSDLLFPRKFLKNRGLPPFFAYIYMCGCRAKKGV